MDSLCASDSAPSPAPTPDGLRLGRGPENGAGGNPSQGYPPVGNFYFDGENPEKRYLWRWICFHAPDLVLEVQSGSSSVQWECNAAARHLAPALAAREIENDSLLGALGDGYPEGLGTIPALRLTASDEQLPREISRLFGVSFNRLVCPASPRPGRFSTSRRQRSKVEIAHILASGLRPFLRSGRLHPGRACEWTPSSGRTGFRGQ